MSKSMKDITGIFLAKTTMLFAVLILCFSMITSAHAQTLAYIQTSIDLSSWEIVSAVVRENVGLTSHSPEIRRVDDAILSSLVSNSSSMANSITALNGLAEYAQSYDNDDEPKTISANGNVIGAIAQAGEYNCVLTFPGQHKFISSSAADMNQALDVNDSLIYDLNQAFSLWLKVKGITPTPNMTAFHSSIVAFLGEVNSSKVAGESGTYIYKLTVDGTTYEFTCVVPKGYMGAYKKDGLQTSTKDAEYVNWGMLAFEGFNNYFMEGNEAITTENVYSSNPSQLEKAMVSFFGNMLDGLRGILGMWSLDDLLYNQGYRGKSYVGGVFPQNWESTVWALFIVMEIFAAMVIMYGIITNVVRKAMSTTNPIARMRVMGKVKDLIVCAIALSILPLALRIVLSFSSSMTGMAYDMIQASDETVEIADLVIRYSSSSGTIAGIIAQFLFFGVQVYFNFFYALRSLTVAILIMIAPLMISFAVISDDRKGMTISWMKELVANIFVQPIQAFIMGIVLILPKSSHGFDNLIALYAIIPLTSAIRSLFFGNSGSWMDNAAQKAKSKLTGAMAAGTLAVGGAVASGAISALGNKNGGNASGGEQGGEGDTTDGAGAAGAVGGVDNTNNENSASTESSSSGGSNQFEGATPEPGSSAIGDNADSASEPALARIGGAINNARNGIGEAVKNNNPIKQVAGGVVDTVSNSKVGKAISANAKYLGGTNLGQKVGQVAGAVKDAAGTLKGAAPHIAAGAVISGLGGALAGAGVPGANSFSNLGHGIAVGACGQNAANNNTSGQEESSQSSGEQAPTPGQEQGLNDGGNISDTELAIANSSPTELGSDNSMFKDNGEVNDYNDNEVHRYTANESALEEGGFSDLDGNGPEITGTVDPSAGGEAAELGNYADYLQGLNKNQRIEFRNQTGVSATRGANGKVNFSINKKKWSEAHGGGSIRMMKNGAMRIETPVGTPQSIVGGISYATDPISTKSAPTVSTASTPESSLSQRAESYKSAPGITAQEKFANMQSSEQNISAAPVKQYIPASNLSESQKAVLDNEIAQQQIAAKTGQQYTSSLEGVQNVRMRGDAYEVTRTSADAAQTPIQPPETPISYKQAATATDSLKSVAQPVAYQNSDNQPPTPPPSPSPAPNPNPSPSPPKNSNPIPIDDIQGLFD